MKKIAERVVKKVAYERGSFRMSREHLRMVAQYGECRGRCGSDTCR